MSFLPLRSMRARMTAGFVLFMSVVVLTGTVMLVVLLQHIARTRAVANLDVAYVSAQSILQRYSSEHHGPISLAAMMREKQSEIAGTDVVAQVIDMQGNVLWQSQKDISRWAPNIAPWRWRALELNQQKLVISIPWKTMKLELMERSWALIVLGILVVLGTALGVWWVVGRTLSPISALSWQVRQASKEDLQVRLEAPSQDAEMVDLVSTFNELLKYLGEEAVMRSRFYAIASHELRTPLQALSGHLELSLSRPRASEEYQKVIHESLGQTRRLISLVQALLQLYQIENREVPEPVEIKLSKIIDSQLVLLRPWVERRNLQLHADVETLDWSAPPGHFDIVVRNLLENAAKYSSRGGSVTISLHRHGTKVLLKISNQCDPAEAAHNKGGASASRMDSYGLGMTICQAIADANGWQLEMSRQDNWMVVSVWMT